MASIALKGIVKRYGEAVTAVNDFHLEIKDKEFIVLVGPSGCGKSTVLRMIAGLEDITSGELYINDALVNQVAPKGRNIAMVFQNYALYPHMNVYKNMEFGLKMRKIESKKIKEIILKTAKQLQIEDLLMRKPAQLSGGQRQRVALGRAMVREPEVFLLDEPLSNLDAKLRTEMRVGISKLHKQLETTFVYVTHDQTEAMTMADRIVVMKDGCIQQVDTPNNIYQFPFNLFVASFIGTPQMNILTARVGKDETSYFISIFEKKYALIDGRFHGAVLEKYIDQQVYLGVRPEDIHFSIEESDQCYMEAEVEGKEELGSECYLHLTHQGCKMIVKTDGREEIKVRNVIFIGFSLNRIHLFDEKTEENMMMM